MRPGSSVLSVTLDDTLPPTPPPRFTSKPTSQSTRSPKGPSPYKLRNRSFSPTSDIIEATGSEVSDLSCFEVFSDEEDESISLDVTRPSTRNSESGIKSPTPLIHTSPIMAPLPHKSFSRVSCTSTVDLFSSPEKGSSPLSSPRGPRTLNLDETHDLFGNSSQDESDIILLDSPQPETSEKSEVKRKSIPFKRKSSYKSPPKQLTLHRFMTASVSPRKSRKNPQLKMDLFVKWKDANKNESAAKARAISFDSPSSSAIPSSPDVKIDKFNKSDVILEDDDVIGGKKIGPPSAKRRSDESRFSRTSENKVGPNTESPLSKNSKLHVKSSVFPLSPRKNRDNIKEQNSSISNPSSSTAKRAQDLTSPRKMMAKASRNLTEREKKMRELLNGSFKEKHSRGNLKKMQEEKLGALKDGEVIRNKADRARMHANDCPCCTGYYEALDLSPESKQKRIQQVSRHRYVEQPLPKTPEHYWEVGFPSESEQKRRGLIKVGSPMKTVSKKLF